MMRASNFAFIVLLLQTHEKPLSNDSELNPAKHLLRRDEHLMMTIIFFPYIIINDESQEKNTIIINENLYKMDQSL